MNVVVEVNTSNLNPKFPARYEGRTFARCRHTPEDNKPRRFLQIADSSWFRSTSLYLSLFNICLCSRYCSRINLSLAVPFCELYTIFPFFICMTFIMTVITDEDYYLCHFLQSARFKYFRRQSSPKQIDRARIMSLSHCITALLLATGCHFVFVSFVASLKSNLYTALKTYSTIEITVLYKTQKRLHFSLMCCNWNKSLTGQK